MAVARELIQDRLRNDPQLSNRSLASNLGITERTVRTVRQELERTEEIPVVIHTRGQDGRLHLRRSVSGSRRRSTRKQGDSATSPETQQRESPSQSTVPALPFLEGRYRQSRSRPSGRDYSGSSVLAQLRTAFTGHPLAFLVALPFGGFVPLAVWCLTHLEAIQPWDWPLIAGGTLFSSLTVIQWGQRILLNTAKAIGFAVLVEGVMIAAQTIWLSLLALCLLIVINSIACSVALTPDADAT